jgi:hypothetical protein
MFPVVLNDENIDPIILDELMKTLTQLRNKVLGLDAVNMELLIKSPLMLLQNVNGLLVKHVALNPRDSTLQL